MGRRGSRTSTGTGRPRKAATARNTRKRKRLAIIGSVVILPFAISYAAEYLAGITPTPGSEDSEQPPSSSPTSPSTSVAGNPPVAIDLVEMESEEFGLGNTHVLPEPIDLSDSELAQLNKLTHQDQRGWFKGNGSVPLDRMQLKVVLRGNSDKQVRIMQITADKRCSSPYDGTIFWDPPGGAEEDIIRLGFDLDSDPSHAQELKGYRFVGPYFSEKTISLKRDEDVVFFFYVTTRQRYCSFKFLADILHDGQKVPLIIDNKGRPFELTAVLRDTDGQWDPTQYKVAYEGKGILPKSDYGMQWGKMAQSK